jgi:phage terminase large subunit
MEGRLCNAPFDPMLKVHVVTDLGGVNTMAIGMVQKHASEIRIIDYIEGGQEDLAGYSRVLKERTYNWGRMWLPHDGFAKSINSPKSSASQLEALGWDVVPREEIVELSVEEGIKQVQSIFPRFYFDRTKTAVLIESVRRYRRHLNRQTDSFGSPVGDQFAHGADMLRYVALNVDNMRNEDMAPLVTMKPLRMANQGQGWML